MHSRARTRVHTHINFLKCNSQKNYTFFFLHALLSGPRRQDCVKLPPEGALTAIVVDTPTFPRGRTPPLFHLRDLLYFVFIFSIMC